MEATPIGVDDGVGEKSPDCRSPANRSISGLRMIARMIAKKRLESRPIKLKIAVLGTRGIPAKHGGIERHCEELYTRLARLGHDVTVFTRSRYVESQTDLYKGVKLKPLPTIYTKHLETIIHTLNASFMALFGDYDVVHYHGIGPSLLSWIPRLKPGTKVVSTCHALEWERAKWGRFAKLCLKLGERSAVAFSHGMICVSSHLCRYFEGAYGRRAVCIPNGVSAAKDAEASVPAADRLDCPRRRGYFLFVGRLVPEKGIHLLIKAFKKLKADVDLVIAGGSSNTDDYVEKIQNMASGDKRISFPGYVYGESLSSLYSNALAFVLPSDVEGMPISLLEAMAHGIPAIASDIDPNREVMGTRNRFGYLFKRGDGDDLKEKLELALNDRLLRAKGLQARDFVSKHYSWDEIAGMTEEFYFSLFDAVPIERRRPISDGPSDLRDLSSPRHPE